MESEGDLDYLSFLSHLRVSDDSFMLEIIPDGASSPLRVKYGEINPTSEMKPGRKRTRRNSSPIDPEIKESGADRSGFEQDSVRSSKKRRKEKKEKGSSKNKLDRGSSSGNINNCNLPNYPISGKASENAKEISDEVIIVEKENARIEEENENPVTKDASLDERAEVQSQCASPLGEPIPTHLEVLMLLMKKLCPVEKTIYPGWSDDKEGVIRPMAEPSKSKNVEFDCIEEKSKEVKLSLKGNKRGNFEAEIETIAAIPEPSDSDEDPIMDIPVEVSSRPPSRYKDRLIRELKMPFDKCECRELMKIAAHRNKKVIYKELRSIEAAIETETAPRVRERAIETEEDSKSFFDWYPEVERKIKKVRLGCRLTLLRGFFFWLQNCSWEESFKPWKKWHKKAKGHLRNDSVTPG